MAVTSKIHQCTTFLRRTSIWSWARGRSPRTQLGNFLPEADSGLRNLRHPNQHPGPRAEFSWDRSRHHKPRSLAPTRQIRWRHHRQITLGSRNPNAPQPESRWRHSFLVQASGCPPHRAALDTTALISNQGHPSFLDALTTMRRVLKNFGRYPLRTRDHEKKRLPTERHLLHRLAESKTVKIHFDACAKY